MSTSTPYFEKAIVQGFTRAELEAVADMAKNHPGWGTVEKYLDAIMGPMKSAVYANTDPAQQLVLHKGLGAIYVAANLEEFVSSAADEADILMQREESARKAAEQTDENQV